MKPLMTILAALAMLLAGCGGGVSKDDYAEDLNEVCAEIESQTEKIGEAEVSNPQELSAQLDEIRAAIRDGIAKMRDIERPDGEDGKRAEEYIDKLQQTLDGQVVPALDDLEKAVQERDQQAIRAAASRLQAVDEEETDRLAEELGADECADG